MEKIKKKEKKGTRRSSLGTRMRGVRSHAILVARPHFSMPIFFSPPRSRSDDVREGGREGERVRRDRTGWVV